MTYKIYQSRFKKSSLMSSEASVSFPKLASSTYPAFVIFQRELGRDRGPRENHSFRRPISPHNFLSLSLSLSNTLIVFFLLQRSSIEPLQKASLTLSISFISLSFITLSFISLSLSLTQLCAQLSWNGVTVRRRRRSATVSCLCEPRPQRGGCWKFWDEFENEKSVWATTLSDASVNYFDSNFWTYKKLSMKVGEMSVDDLTEEQVLKFIITFLRLHWELHSWQCQWALQQQLFFDTLDECVCPLANFH